MEKITCAEVSKSPYKSFKRVQAGEEFVVVSRKEVLAYVTPCENMADVDAFGLLKECREKEGLNF